MTARCQNCARLQMEMESIQKKYTLDFNSLKKKIISTDMLIKTNLLKQQECETLTQQSESLKKLLQGLHDDFSVQETKLSQAIQELDPLREEKASLEATLFLQAKEIEVLKEKLAGSQVHNNQLEMALKFKETANKEQASVIKTQEKRLSKMKQVEDRVVELESEVDITKEAKKEAKKEAEAKVVAALKLAVYFGRYLEKRKIMPPKTSQQISKLLKNCQNWPSNLESGEQKLLGILAEFGMKTDDVKGFNGGIFPLEAKREQLDTSVEDNEDHVVDELAGQQLEQLLLKPAMVKRERGQPRKNSVTFDTTVTNGCVPDENGHDLAGGNADDDCDNRNTNGGHMSAKAKTFKTVQFVKSHTIHFCPDSSFDNFTEGCDNSNEDGLNENLIHCTSGLKSTVMPNCHLLVPEMSRCGMNEAVNVSAESKGQQSDKELMSIFKKMCSQMNAVSPLPPSPHPDEERNCMDTETYADSDIECNFTHAAPRTIFHHQDSEGFSPTDKEDTTFTDMFCDLPDAMDVISETEDIDNVYEFAHEESAHQVAPLMYGPERSTDTQSEQYADGLGSPTTRSSLHILQVPSTGSSSPASSVASTALYAASDDSDIRIVELKLSDLITSIESRGNRDRLLGVEIEQMLKPDPDKHETTKSVLPMEAMQGSEMVDSCVKPKTLVVPQITITDCSDYYNDDASRDDIDMTDISVCTSNKPVMKENGAENMPSTSSADMTYTESLHKTENVSSSEQLMICQVEETTNSFRFKDQCSSREVLEVTSINSVLSVPETLAVREVVSDEVVESTIKSTALHSTTTMLVNGVDGSFDAVSVPTNQNDTKKFCASEELVDRDAPVSALNSTKVIFITGQLCTESTNLTSETPSEICSNELVKVKTETKSELVKQNKVFGNIDLQNISHKIELKNEVCRRTSPVKFSEQLASTCSARTKLLTQNKSGTIHLSKTQAEFLVCKPQKTLKLESRAKPVFETSLVVVAKAETTSSVNTPFKLSAALTQMESTLETKPSVVKKGFQSLAAGETCQITEFVKQKKQVHWCTGGDGKKADEKRPDSSDSDNQILTIRAEKMKRSAKKRVANTVKTPEQASKTPKRGGSLSDIVEQRPEKFSTPRKEKSLADKFAAENKYVNLSEVQGKSPATIENGHESASDNLKVGVSKRKQSRKKTNLEKTVNGGCTAIRNFMPCDDGYIALKKEPFASLKRSTYLKGRGNYASHFVRALAPVTKTEPKTKNEQTEQVKAECTETTVKFVNTTEASNCNGEINTPTTLNDVKTIVLQKSNHSEKCTTAEIDNINEASKTSRSLSEKILEGTDDIREISMNGSVKSMIQQADKLPLRELVQNIEVTEVKGAAKLTVSSNIVIDKQKDGKEKCKITGSAIGTPIIERMKGVEDDNTPGSENGTTEIERSKCVKEERSLGSTITTTNGRPPSFLEASKAKPIIEILPLTASNLGAVPLTRRLSASDTPVEQKMEPMDVHELSPIGTAQTVQKQVQDSLEILSLSVNLQTSLSSTVSCRKTANFTRPLQTGQGIRKLTNRSPYVPHLRSANKTTLEKTSTTNEDATVTVMCSEPEDVTLLWPRPKVRTALKRPCDGEVTVAPKLTAMDAEVTANPESKQTCDPLPSCSILPLVRRPHLSTEELPKATMIRFNYVKDDSVAELSTTTTVDNRATLGLLPCVLKPPSETEVGKSGFPRFIPSHSSGCVEKKSDSDEICKVVVEKEFSVESNAGTGKPPTRCPNQVNCSLSLVSLAGNMQHEDKGMPSTAAQTSVSLCKTGDTQNSIQLLEERARRWRKRNRSADDETDVQPKQESKRLLKDDGVPVGTNDSENVVVQRLHTEAAVTTVDTRKKSSCESDRVELNRTSSEMFATNLNHNAQMLTSTSSSSFYHAVADAVEETDPVVLAQKRWDAVQSLYRLQYDKPDVPEINDALKGIFRKLRAGVDKLSRNTVDFLKKKGPSNPVISKQGRILLDDLGKLADQQMRERSQTMLFDLILVTIFSKRCVQKEGLSMLVRVYAELCRRLNDVERLRILCYDLMYRHIVHAGHLIVHIVNVWDSTFAKSESGSPVLLDVMLRLLLHHDLFKLDQCHKLTLRSHYEITQENMSQRTVATDLLEQLETAACSSDLSAADEVVRALLLLAKVAGWEWTNNTLIHKMIWTQLREWSKSQSKDSDGAARPEDVVAAHIIKLLGCLCCNCPKEDGKPVYSVMTTLKELLGQAKTDPIPSCVEEACVEVLIMLKDFRPQITKKALAEWNATARNVSPWLQLLLRACAI